MTKKKIICLFDYKANTGYGTVSSNLLPIIKAQFGDKIHLDIVAINYFGKDQKGVHDFKFNEDANTTVYSAKLYDANKRSNPTDDFGRDLFCKLCLQNDYSGMFIMQDIGVVSAMMPLLKEVYQKKIAPKSIFYFPIDADFYPKELYNGLDWFDVLITYTVWGKNVVLKSKPNFANKLCVIPHGINLEQFYKVDDDLRETFINSYFGRFAKDRIVFGNINRNQPRKDIATTILAFEAAKNKIEQESGISNIFLYLHMNPNDPLGNDLRFLLNQTSLVEGEDYMFPKQDYEPHLCTVEKLNLIYNGLDYFVTSALGGGWELTTYEALATCKNVIVPNHTCFKHLHDLEVTIKAADDEIGYEKIVNADNVIRQKVKLKELANTIYFCSKQQVPLPSEVKISEYLKTITWYNIGEKFCKLFSEYFKIH